MHARAVKLLRAASEMVGGDEALARRLDIDEGLLRRLLSGQFALPERVLLGTVDIILANHQYRISPNEPEPPSAHALVDHGTHPPLRSG